MPIDDLILAILWLLIPVAFIASSVMLLWAARKSLRASDAMTRTVNAQTATFIAKLAFLDNLTTGVNRLVGEAATLTRDLRALLDAERGLSEVDLQERIDRIKEHARELKRQHGQRGDRILMTPWDQATDETAECKPCECTVTGWAGPHCHYHIMTLPDMTACTHKGLKVPR